MVIATIGLLAYKASADSKEQTALITGFYKNYVKDREHLRNDNLLGGSFYSKNVEALLTINRERCESPARNDEVCGYDADSDVADTANKIFTYISDDDGPHYIEERMVFPVEICDHSGTCR